MKFHQILAIAATMLGGCAIPFGTAAADTVIYDGISLFQGQQAFMDSFTVATPGSLTMTVTDIPWLDPVSNQSFFLSSATGLLGSTMADGGETLSVGPGTYYAHWLGDAAGSYGMSVVGVSIEFQPNGAVVGLPASLLLLLSGLGLLFGWQRRGAPAELAYP